MRSFFQSGAVVDNLVSTDKYAAIAEVIARTGVFDSQSQRGSIETAVVSREREQTTGIGHGVAACHGRTRDVDQVIVALGISRAGLDFGAADGQLVHLLFVLATPPGWHRDYLQALAGICKLRRSNFLSSLLAAPANELEIQQRLRGALDDVTASAAIRRRRAKQHGATSEIG